MLCLFVSSSTFALCRQGLFGIHVLKRILQGDDSGTSTSGGPAIGAIKLPASLGTVAITALPEVLTAPNPNALPPPSPSPPPPPPPPDQITAPAPAPASGTPAPLPAPVSLC